MTPALAKSLNRVCILRQQLLCCLAVSLVVLLPGALAQQTQVTPAVVSEDQIANVVTSTTPTYLLGMCKWPAGYDAFPPEWWIYCDDSAAVQMPVVTTPTGWPGTLWNLWYYLGLYDYVGTTNNFGSVRSAVFKLGNGHYLYAYQLYGPGNEWGADMTITRLTVPLGTHALSSVDGIPSGTFAAFPSFGQYHGVFNFQDLVDPSNTHNVASPASDPITSVYLSGDPAVPDSITFIAPGDTMASPNYGGFPNGVLGATVVFGFVADVPPRIIQGQFAGNDGGFYVPAFHMVVPGGLEMVDPVPDLLDGPKLAADGETLATKGRTVEGVSADGVTQVLLRMSTSNVGDQVQFTLQNFASPDDDGALGNPGDTEFSQSTVTVTSVNTSQGPMAFAVYRAPSDFAQTSVHGVSCASRTETLQVQVTSQGASPPLATLPIPILRPPVILVHGMWANQNAWNNFALRTDNCFTVRAADYSQFQSALSPSPITASTPPYDDGGVLAAASSDSLGFSFNAPAVFVESGGFLSEFRKGQNRLQIPVAAVQADFVTHSMGGLIVRTMPTPPAFADVFYDQTTFGQGLIHKLITIGTPHLGSPLATYLLQDSSSCMRNNFLAEIGGLPSFESVTFASGYVANGAVGDLSGDGQGATLSDALRNIFFQGSAKLIPTAMIAGVQPDFSSLDNSISIASDIRNILCPGDFIADHLTASGWPTLVSPNSDAIVPLTSQWDGQSGAQVNGVIHTGQFTALGFSGSGELDAASGMSDEVTLFLNTPVSSLSAFKKVAP